jgi:hypothetical protein
MDSETEKRRYLSEQKMEGNDILYNFLLFSYSLLHATASSRASILVYELCYTYVSQRDLEME